LRRGAFPADDSGSGVAVVIVAVGDCQAPPIVDGPPPGHDDTDTDDDDDDDDDVIGAAVALDGEALDEDDNDDVTSASVSRPYPSALRATL
jgi:hypothetical protein